MLQKESIFTKMIQGKVTCQKVYEDELTFAFLDQNPVTKGHLLVLPKEEIDHIDDCPPDLYHAVYETVRKLSQDLRKAFSPLRVAVVVKGTDVPHAHIHLLPLYTGAELQLASRESNIKLIQDLPLVAKSLLKVIEE